MSHTHTKIVSGEKLLLANDREQHCWQCWDDGYAAAMRGVTEVSGIDKDNPSYMAGFATGRAKLKSDGN